MVEEKIVPTDLPFSSIRIAIAHTFFVTSRVVVVELCCNICVLHKGMSMHHMYSSAQKYLAGNVGLKHFILWREGY